MENKATKRIITARRGWLSSFTLRENVLIFIVVWSVCEGTDRAKLGEVKCSETGISGVLGAVAGECELKV